MSHKDGKGGWLLYLDDMDLAAQNNLEDHNNYNYYRPFKAFWIGWLIYSDHSKIINYKKGWIKWRVSFYDIGSIDQYHSQTKAY